jgi:hypothetical protein
MCGRSSVVRTLVRRRRSAARRVMRLGEWC